MTFRRRIPRLLNSLLARSIYRPLALLGDMAAVSAALLSAYYARFEWVRLKSIFPATKGIPPLSNYLPFLPAMLVLWMLVMARQGGYRHLNIPLLDELIRILKVSGLATLLVMAATFLYRETELSRLAVGLMGLWGVALLFLWREILKMIRMNLVGRLPKRILIIGHGRLATSLERVLVRHKDSAILKRHLGSLEELLHVLNRSRIDEVLLAEPNLNHKEAVALAILCDEAGIRCRIVPNILEIRMGEVLIDDSLGITTFQLKPLALRGGTFLAKRIFDCVVSVLVLSVLSLPLLLICVLIKLDSPGPVLFKQPRVGHKGKEFSFFKFRTMVRGAENLLPDLKIKSERAGPVFKMKEDPRITHVGRLLRRYSLDEIPQLINVLRGDMSLVGPRPQVIWEAKAYDDWAKKRLSVLPGITGLWQVSGRADLTYEEMIDLDIYYLEHWSPGLDLKILLRTLPSILRGHGAY